MIETNIGVQKMHTDVNLYNPYPCILYCMYMTSNSMSLIVLLCFDSIVLNRAENQNKPAFSAFCVIPFSYFAYSSIMSVTNRCCVLFVEIGPHLLLISLCNLHFSVEIVEQ